MNPSKELDLYIATRDRKRIVSEENFDAEETNRRMSLAIQGKEYSTGKYD